MVEGGLEHGPLRARVEEETEEGCCMEGCRPLMQESHCTADEHQITGLQAKKKLSINPEIPNLEEQLPDSNVAKLKF
jgi:hypothetical protein